MKVTKEVFERMYEGDYVLVKTLGQLIDSGWTEQNGVYVHEDCWAGVIPSAMSNHLGQLCRIKTINVNPITGDRYVTLDEDEHEFQYTIEMMHQLYPLMRGLS